jgi:hypothetical protein
MKTNNKQWQGYSFDELKQAIEQNKFDTELDRTRIAVRLAMLKNGLNPTSSSTYRKLLGALNIADYIVLGVKAVKILAPLFRKRRNTN